MPSARNKPATERSAAAAQAEGPAPLGLPRPEGGWKALALLLAFLQPWAGLGLALLYWKAGESSARGFARWCLALALVSAALAGVFGPALGAWGEAERSIQPW